MSPLYGLAMGTLPGIVVTCVVSVVCGFLGALGAVTVLQGQLQGPQGASGLSVEVVTDVTVRNQEIQLQKQPVCVTG